MSARRARQHFNPGIIVTATVASLFIALGASGTISAYVASIVNSTNTAATGVLTMQETNSDGTVICKSTDANTTNNATCSTINKYGGTTNPLIPGTPQVTTVKIKNTGNIPATAFTVDGGTCTATAVSGAGFTGSNVTSATVGLCTKVNVEIKSGTTTIYTGTAAAFDAAAATDILSKLSVTNIAAGAETTFTVSVTLDSTADSTYQGGQISQPITWSMGA